MQQYECIQCGKTFLKEAYRKPRFCSQECYHLYRRRSLVSRFWPHVDKSAGPDGCWLWTGATNNKGYGMLNNRGKVSLAHRVSLELRNGPIPGSLEALHKCDNPLCVNPAHLRLGTHKENMQDSKDKGRNSPPPLHCGESHWDCKLTESKVLDIRSRYAQGGITQRQLAEQFGVHLDTISLIIRRLTWRHL